MDRNSADYQLGFLEGQIKGISDFAIWRDGGQFVGCLERPLGEVLKPLIEKRNLLLAKENDKNE